MELAFPSHDLRWAHAIGVTSVGSRVYAKFDAVKIGGFRYPIDSIYKLTREEARNWNAAPRGRVVELGPIAGADDRVY